MPPALKNRPEVGSHLLPYIDAYNFLRGFRTRSECGHNPIAYGDVVTYAQTHGFMDNRETFERFEILIQACDQAFLVLAEEKQRQAMAKIKRKP